MSTPRLAIAFCLASLSTAAHAVEPTLARIFADPPLGGRPPMALQIAPGFDMLAFLRPSAADSEVLDLWGQRLSGGEPRLLVASASLLGAGTQKLTEAERMALERKRITARGITEFMWCGEGTKALLFPLSGDLYWARLRDGKPPEVARLTTDDDVPELAPQCSPRGNFVSFTKGGDLHVLEIANRQDTRLTERRGENIFGLAEFIAEEEMDRHVGHWWSRDEARLIAFEVDETSVGTKVRPLIHADRTEMYTQRYPAAGEANAKVTAHLIDRKTRTSVLLNLPEEDGYLPRAGFFADGSPWVQWQSRDQRRLVVFEGQTGPLSGAMKPVLTEEDPAWVTLHDDLVPLSARPELFVWSSERSGLRQLELVNRKTGERRPLTTEPEAVDGVLSVDETLGRVNYSVCRSRGRERHIYAVPLSGGPSIPLATEPGWHAATFSGDRYIDVHSRWGRPPVTTLRPVGHGQSKLLDKNPTPELDALPILTVEWRDFVAEDGTLLNGLLIPPANVKHSVKYPVIAWVYGGPMHQQVANRWMRHHPLLVHLTQRGFGIFMVDNRGAGGRGRDIDRAHHMRFGDVEVKDLFAATRALASVDWVDPSRIGVWGWSYGGYLAARAVLDTDTPFAAAVAIAPVTDWTLYDTHYTERYLGRPDGGKAPQYANSNLLTRATLLKKPLMLIHGTADDNVLFENSLRLIDALQRESVPFELMIYPGKAHGISGRAAQRHVYETSFGFFDRTLAR
jgi:dipeptidyl-peptidase-4